MITDLRDFAESKVLIVDDLRVNLQLLTMALKNQYRILTAMNGREALACAEREIPDLILLDIVMPDMDGYEVCVKLKRNERTRNIPIIFISAVNEIESKKRGFDLGAVDYITKPFEAVEVRARVHTHLLLKKSMETLQMNNRTLEAKVQERTRELFDRAKELSETQREIVYRLARAAEFRDNETGLHIKRMSYYCALLARAAGLSRDDCELIYHTSAMHDIGKLGIPDHILLKPGRLDSAEREIMQRHTIIGADILSGHPSKLLETARTIALTHHEKWNGSGYPQGLSKEEIPLEGRIAGLCDVFDALTSARPYKRAWTVEEAMAEIEQESGEHFDPHLVKLFGSILPKVVVIKERFTESEDYHFRSVESCTEISSSLKLI